MGIDYSFECNELNSFNFCARFGIMTARVWSPPITQMRCGKKILYKVNDLLAPVWSKNYLKMFIKSCSPQCDRLLIHKSENHPLRNKWCLSGGMCTFFFFHKIIFARTLHTFMKYIDPVSQVTARKDTGTWLFEGDTVFSARHFVMKPVCFTQKSSKTLCHVKCKKCSIFV